MAFKNQFLKFVADLAGKVKRRFSKPRRKALPKPSKKRSKTLVFEGSAEAPLLIESPAPPPAANGPKVLEAIAEFSEVQLSVHTQRAYRRDLEDFFAFLRTQGIWNDWSASVTPIHVAQYRQYLIRDRGLAKGSVTRKIAVLKSFYKWTVARGWLRENPAEFVKSFPQTQESKTGFLSDPEIHRLLRDLPPANSPSLSRALRRVVIETLLMLGIRRSEAAGLRVGDLEYTDGRWIIRVRGKGDRDRLLPLPPRLLDSWSTWLQRISEEAPPEPLSKATAAWADWTRRHETQPILISSRAQTFDQPLSTSEIARIVRKCARLAGIVNRVSPHMLRATAITHALDQGASHRGVQQMAGWTSPLMITRYDKRRKDPRFSAVLNLRYAHESDDAPPTESTAKTEPVLSLEVHGNV